MEVGDTFEGGYRIIRELGRGASSRVYLGEHTEIGQRVAIKLIFAGSERVTREGRVLAKLNSPHTVRLLAFGRTEFDEQYMIFEWVDGEPLTDFIKRNAPVGWQQTCDILRQVLIALGEAHGQNITHRDIKPGNLMITGDLELKVLDFGVAKVHNAPSITAAHQVPGTPRYMAPEVFQTGKASPSADIFALGMVAHELLTASHPVVSRELDQIIAQHASPQPYTLPPLQIPAPVRTWIERMMQKDPAQRFVDANAALAAMPEIAETTHEHASVTEPVQSPMAGVDVEETLESAVILDTGDRPKHTVGREKNRPPSKFLWPTIALPTVDDSENWSTTVLLGGLLLFAAIVLAGLYQAGAFDPPKRRPARVNPIVPDKPILSKADAGTSTEHVRGSIKGIAHFEQGEYIEALKEFHRIEQTDDAFEKASIEEGNYAQRALAAIADQAEEDAAAAETLEEIEAAAHDPQVAQSLYRGDERINAVVDKLRKMGREAERAIERRANEERKKKKRRR